MNNTYLVHGRDWSRHKYIRKEGDKYIYPTPSGAGESRSGRTMDSYLDEGKYKPSVTLDRQKLNAAQRPQNHTLNDEIPSKNDREEEIRQALRRIDQLQKEYEELNKKQVDLQTYYNNLTGFLKKMSGKN